MGPTCYTVPGLGSRKQQADSNYRYYTREAAPPPVRCLWEEEATEAVPENMRVGCRVSSGVAGVDEGRDTEEAPGSEGEEGGPGPP